MNPSPQPAAGSDIGTILAIVGTNGWRCCICKTTFQRSFSIEHHMITSHHPLSDSILSAASNSSTSCGDEHSSVDQEPRGLVQDLTSAGSLAEENDSHKRAKTSISVSSATPTAVESMAGTSSYQSVGETFGDLMRDGVADAHNRRCTVQDGSLSIKVEPHEDSMESSPPQSSTNVQNSLSNAQVSTEEGLPVFFSAKVEPIAVSQAIELGVRNAFDGSASSNPETNIPKVLHTEMVSPHLPQSQPEHSLVGDMVAGNANQISRRRPGTRLPSDSGKSSKRRICSCGNTFDNKHDFRHHRRDVHCKSHKKVFVCPICNAQYSYKRGLNRHLQEKGTVPVECSECKQQFHDTISLDVHRKSCNHSEQSQGSSSQIQPSLAVSWGLEATGQTQATSQGMCDSKSDSSSISINSQGNETWECSKCFQHFSEKQTFRTHLKFCGILRFRDNERAFHCNLCNASFPWLKQYYQHYVNDHKLVEARNSPASYSPFTGNSRVSSPALSVTSEINKAMAGVDLNQSNASCGTSPFSSIIDLTDDHVGMSELGRYGEDDGVERSSNPQSLTSTTTSSSEQVRDGEAIIVSDVDDYQNSDSSSDSDCDWDHRKWESKAAEAWLRHGMHPPPFGHPPHSRPPFHPDPSFRSPPPPPPPHLHPPFGVPDVPPHAFFPPPHYGHHRHHHGHHHHHHHHGHRFGHGMGFFGRRMHGPRLDHMFSRFGCPVWPPQQESDSSDVKSDKPQTQTSESTATPSIATSTTPSQTTSAAADHETVQSEAKASPHGTAGEESGSSARFPNAAHWLSVAAAWKEKKAAKVMMKAVLQSVVISYLQGKACLVCPECQQTFSEDAELQKHMEDSHSSSRQYTCFMCKQTCSDAVSFNLHMRQHCEMFISDAGRGFGRGRGHGRGRWKGFKGKGVFFKMLDKFGFLHGLQDQNLGDLSQNSDRDNSGSGDSSMEEFKECPVCHKKFRANSRENFYERHVNSHYGVDVYKYECEECGKKFLEKGKFTAHQATHRASPTHVCQTCGKSYHNKTSLTRHQMTHTGERPHKCSECGEGFIELRELERHRMVHTGQPAFQCQECQKGFTLKTSLLNHMRKQHPQQNAFICSACSEKFASSQALVQHRKVCVAVQRDGGANADECSVGKQEPTSMELD